MNRDGINKVIALVESSPRFDCWDDDWCIGGICQRSLNGTAKTIAEAFELVAEIEGIYDALNVVYPGIYETLPEKIMISRETAIRMLEIFRDEGIVDWVQAVEDTRNEQVAAKVLVGVAPVWGT